MKERILVKNEQLSSLKMISYNEIKNSLIDISDESCTIYYKDKHNTKKFLCRFLKNKFDDVSTLKKYILEETKTYEPGTYCKKQNEHTSTFYDDILKEANILSRSIGYTQQLQYSEDFHFFFNEIINNHQDCPTFDIRSLMVLKNETMEGLLVFPQFDIYLNMDEGDLLLFDASQYHYVKRNKSFSQGNYRYAINFEMRK